MFLGEVFVHTAGDALNFVPFELIWNGLEDLVGASFINALFVNHVRGSDSFV